MKVEDFEHPDRLRLAFDDNQVDVANYLVSEKLDGVRVFNPQGKAIGHISLPERCPNLCFGGREGNRLFMAGSHSIYALFVNTRGADFA